MVVYIPPDSVAAEYHAALSLVNQEILKIKTDLNDPYLIIGGDLNGRDLGEAIGDYEDIEILPSPPTRNGRRLDLISANFQSECLPIKAIPPRQNDDGIESDLSTLFIEAELTHTGLVINS